MGSSESWPTLADPPFLLKGESHEVCGKNREETAKGHQTVSSFGWSLCLTGTLRGNRDAPVG